MKYLLTSLLYVVTVVTKTESKNSGIIRTFKAVLDERVNNKICYDDLMKRVKPFFKLQCMNECASSKGCVSFFYNKRTKDCQMHGNSLNIGSCALQSEEGYKYYTLNRNYGWKYLGCYMDTADRDLSSESYIPTTLSNTVCAFYCYQAGYKYCGVQFGYWCCCGDNYGRYGPLLESSCSSACVGNTAEYCGGAWANAIFDTGL